MPATEWGEDCLNANIYRPKGSEGKKLPVAAYIHGGAFNGGKGTVYSLHLTFYVVHAHS